MAKQNTISRLICLALSCLVLFACSSSADRTDADDTAGVPSTLDTMNTPLHPGMVDSTGALRTNK